MPRKIRTAGTAGILAARRGRIATALLVAAALGMPAAVAAQDTVGPNLVVNGNFDGSLAGWTEESHTNFTSNYIEYESFESNDTGALQGEGKTEAPPDRHHVAWQCITVEPGRLYRFEGAMRSLAEDEVLAGGTIDLFRAAPTGCSESGEPLRSFGFSDYQSSPWNPYSATIRIPADVNRVQVATRVSAGNFIDDARQEHQSNFVAYDAIGLRELRGDLRIDYAAGAPSGTILPKASILLPLTLENRSDYPADINDVRIAHGGRFALRSFQCPGSVVDISSPGGDHFLWFGLAEMPAKAKYQCTLEIAAKAGYAGPAPLVATANSDNEAVPADNVKSRDFEVIAAADFDVAVTTTQFPQAGATVQAVLTLRNRGTATAAPVFDFAWTGDDGTPVTLAGFTDSCGDFFYDNGLALANFAIGAGATRTCTLGFTWPNDGTQDLTATIKASAAGNDYDLSNNSASDVSQLLRLRLTTTADATDWNPGDGRCETAQNATEPQCSLRAAIMEANAVPGTQTIEIPYMPSPYQLTRSSANGGDFGDVQISGRTLLIGEPLDGNNPELALDFPNGEPGRAIRVESSASFVRIRNLDITGQLLPFNGNGGLVSNASGKLVIEDSALSNGRALGKGGAIHSTGELRLTRVNVTGSTAPIGGAVSFEPPSFDFLTLEDCRFSGNGGADTTDGGALWLTRGLAGIDACTFDANRADRGGAIAALAANFGLVVSNSTISGNTADLEGGGIWTASGLSINTSTIAGNQAAPGNNSAGLGGGVYVVSGADANTYGSILAANTAQVRTASGPGGITLSFPHAAACHGVLDSEGYNSVQPVSSDQLCSMTATTGDHFDAFPNLAALADNGGPTP
ncbi:MAG TPA: hypothetical protein VFO79_06695, partial [Xanthomonadales bacterium]|nr:hypothetical protein [Xanthomonadales bacterium]